MNLSSFPLSIRVPNCGDTMQKRGKLDDLTCPSSSQPFHPRWAPRRAKRTKYKFTVAVAASRVRLVALPRGLELLHVHFTLFRGNWIIGQCLSLAFFNPFIGGKLEIFPLVLLWLRFCILLLILLLLPLGHFLSWLFLAFYGDCNRGRLGRFI
jgi:hypothetical protein